MASLFIGVEDPNLSFRYDVQFADNDMPLILAYLMSESFGQVTENIVSEVPDASWSPSDKETEADRPTIQVQSWVTRAATPEETVQNYAHYIVDQLRAQEANKRKAAAAAAAAAAITPIEPIG